MTYSQCVFYPAVLHVLDCLTQESHLYVSICTVCIFFLAPIAIYRYFIFFISLFRGLNTAFLILDVVETDHGRTPPFNLFSKTKMN